MNKLGIAFFAVFGVSIALAQSVPTLPPPSPSSSPSALPDPPSDILMPQIPTPEQIQAASGPQLRAAPGVQVPSQPPAGFPAFPSQGATSEGDASAKKKIQDVLQDKIGDAMKDSLQAPATGLDGGDDLDTKMRGISTGLDDITDETPDVDAGFLMKATAAVSKTVGTISGSDFLEETLPTFLKETLPEFLANPWVGAANAAWQASTSSQTANRRLDDMNGPQGLTYYAMLSTMKQMENLASSSNASPFNLNPACNNLQSVIALNGNSLTSSQLSQAQQLLAACNSAAAQSSQGQAAASIRLPYYQIAAPLSSTSTAPLAKPTDCPKGAKVCK